MPSYPTAPSHQAIATIKQPPRSVNLPIAPLPFSYQARRRYFHPRTPYLPCVISDLAHINPIRPYVIPRRQPRNLKCRPSNHPQNNQPSQKLKSFEGARGDFYKSSPAVTPRQSPIEIVLPLKADIQNRNRHSQPSPRHSHESGNPETPLCPDSPVDNPSLILLP